MNGVNQGQLLMMLTPHIMAGAALATVMPNSALGYVGAFSIGMVSHYALDSLPHWERLFSPRYNDQLPSNHSLWPKGVYIQGAIDIFMAILLLGYFISVSPTASTFCILLGGVGAALPDIADSSPWWKHLASKVPVWKTAKSIHDNVHMNGPKQRQLPYLTGLFTQLITLGLALLILFRFRVY